MSSPGENCDETIRGGKGEGEDQGAVYAYLHALLSEHIDRASLRKDVAFPLSKLSPMASV